MIHTTKKKCSFLVVAFCLLKTRLRKLSRMSHSVSEKISCFHSVATEKKQVVWNYNASDTAQDAMGRMLARSYQN